MTTIARSSDRTGQQDDRSVRRARATAAEVAFRDALARIDVEVDGSRPWDPQVRNPAFFTRAVPLGSEGILDAYVDGWWECDALDELTARVMRGGVHLDSTRALAFYARSIAARLMNRQTRRRALAIRRHYDIGNDLYAAMLDRRMNYSCAYWASAETLEAAQEAKLDLICRKIGLRPGQRVLDIGCGWGGFAGFAAEKYGASVVGVTLSEPQAALARERYGDIGVDVRVQDYRDVADGPYDAIVSVGMFEHVGYRNYRTFFAICRRLLKPDGLLLLHTIGRRRSGVTMNPWMERNIFPNSMLPSVRQIGEASEGLFIMEDWHVFGQDYDRTLMAWHRNFVAAWAALRATYGDRFSRMWRAYLLVSAGAFRARQNQLWQTVFSPRGVVGGYASVR